MADFHPTATEERLLSLGYSRFLDLYEEITDDKFWQEEAGLRLAKIKDICSVYTELLKYPPLEYVLANAKRPHYALIGRDFTSFLRNLLLHFPYFKNWVN